MIEEALVFCSGEIEESRSFEVEAVFGNGEQEEAKDNHRDLEDATEVTEYAQHVVYFANVLDALFVEEDVLSKYSSRRIIW